MSLLRWCLIVLMACGIAACDSSSIDPDPNPDSQPHPLVDELPIATRSFEIGVAGFVPSHWPNPSDADWQALLNQLPYYGERFGIHVR